MQTMPTLVCAWLILILSHVAGADTLAAQASATAGRTTTPADEALILNAGYAESAEFGSPGPCADGLVDDDGTAETGYGWVPSAIEGIFAQEYSGDEVESGRLSSVCVCWIRTRDDDSIDFEVVLFDVNGSEGMPEKQPYAVFPAHLSGIPQGVPAATFTQIDLGDVDVPADRFFVGVRWNPSVDQFFFACVDKSPRPEPPTRVYFRDDRASGWGVSDETNDTTFNNHEAMLIRPVPSLIAAPQDIPIGNAAIVILMAALALAGVLALRPR